MIPRTSAAETFACHNQRHVQISVMRRVSAAAPTSYRILVVSYSAHFRSRNHSIDPGDYWCAMHSIASADDAAVIRSVYVSLYVCQRQWLFSFNITVTDTF